MPSLSFLKLVSRKIITKQVSLPSRIHQGTSNKQCMWHCCLAGNLSKLNHILYNALYLGEGFICSCHGNSSGFPIFYLLRELLMRCNLFLRSSTLVSGTDEGWEGVVIDEEEEPREIWLKKVINLVRIIIFERLGHDFWLRWHPRTKKLPK